jgi:hypothetical protein
MARRVSSVGTGGHPFKKSSDPPSISVRTVRDTTSTATDDRINLFVKKFDELKGNFDRGTNVQTLVIVHHIEQDVRQLGSTMEEISTSGQISPSPIFCFSDHLSF